MKQSKLNLKNSIKEGLLTVFFLVTTLSVFAQDLTIKRSTGPIKLDGVLDEDAWLESDSAVNWMQFFPFDTSLAVSQTKAMILYDDEFIYIAGVMQNIESDRQYVTPSLRRDFRGEANDSFSVQFDTFKDHTNGFLFGINPFGVRREALIADGGGGRGSFGIDWDNKWYGEAKQYDGYWVAEMAIPFKTLRFNEGQNEWYINFYRVDSENAERSTWSPIPRNFSIINMATHRTLKWDQPTKKPGANISVIPYVTAGASKDFESGTPQDNQFGAGFDVKYGITSGLNLDLTVNPDFSQVEVDQQVTNLDRFEIFFPERRQFFLENADLFANSGNRGTRPFFSRRIGVTQDASTGNNVQNPIPFGARISGKLNNNTRVGLLSMQAGADGENGLPSYNYFVGTVQQKVFTRSNVAFMFVNKQTFADETEYGSDSLSAYNRTLGVDYNLASADNRWNGKFFYHQSIDEIQPDSAFAAGASIDFSTYKWDWRLFSQVVGANYNPEVGFVRRRDIRQLASTVRYRWFPSGGSIQSHGPGFDFDMLGNDTYGFLDWDVNILYNINFRNTAEFSSRLRKEYTYLFNSFDPSGSGGLELGEDTEYKNYVIIAQFRSDARKKVFFNASTRSGQYFNGTRLNLQGSIGYRYQPFGFTSIDFQFNSINLPEPYNSANLYLIGPRFDFTFTKKLFWTTLVQYNSQIENLSLNSRLQWRFKPVSDFFLVYTDNYFAFDDRSGLIQIGAPKTRSLVFKLTYWLNL